MKSNDKAEILFIDTDGFSKLDQGMVLHPEQLKYATKIEKESFDKVYIHNTPSFMLSHKYFFYINKLLRKKGKVEILVSQKISVLQDLDAEEIVSNGKLAGFTTVETDIYERFENVDGNDIKIKSLRVSMFK